MISTRVATRLSWPPSSFQSVTDSLVDDNRAPMNGRARSSIGPETLDDNDRTLADKDHDPLGPSWVSHP